MFRPVPKPVFKKRVKGGEFSDAVKAEIDQRSGGLCEGKDCPDRTGGGWPLAYAHRYHEGKPNRGMGGTRREPTADDGWKACVICHGKEDHHLRQSNPTT